MDHLPHTLVIYAVGELLSTKLRNKFQDGHQERKSFGNYSKTNSKTLLMKPVWTSYHNDQYCTTNSGRKQKMNNIAQQNTDGEK